MKRRILVISDLHCGARTGLTPPDWRTTSPKEHGRSRWANTQKACWNWYVEEIDALGKVDLLIVNGDAIDGRGKKSKGTELITADRDEQSDIAAACIEQVNLRKSGEIHIIRGTPYHTGQGEDWEDVLADKVNATKVHNHAYLTVHGITFDVKHKVGSSTVPHGRHTASARERLWNQLWADRYGAPRAQVVIRSHVHYHTYCGGPDWLAMTTPALQAFGSKYGARQCAGTVDFGFVHFDVADDGSWSWAAHLAYLDIMRPKETRVF